MRSGTAVADEVARWLEDRDLDRLLAEHLEQQLPTLSGDRRREAAVRLARLYASLLVDLDDRSLRLSLEERGRRLLQEVKGDSAIELRLELAHGTYLGIERAAERHRLRLLGEQALVDVQERIGELIQELSRLSTVTGKMLERAERSSSRRSRLELVRSRLAQLREMSIRIEFLLGWSAYYRAWLSATPSVAETALPRFLKVLGIDELKPTEVSSDLRSEPGIAWTIIGIAMVKSLQGEGAGALRWIDLLDAPQVPEDIRSQLPGWRLAILLEQEDFAGASGLLATVGSDPLSRPLAWTRLTAVAALEGRDQPGAAQLAANALADLATMGEEDQIQDLVERFPDAVRGDSFPFQYARAVLAYRAAAEGDDAEPPATAMERRRRWEAAARAIETALESDDSVRFAQATIQAKLLLAWSQYSLDAFEDARDLFAEVSRQLPDSEGAEALWQAFLAEERRLAATGASDRTQADRLVRQYLDRYPKGSRAGELMVRRASAGETPSLERVEELLRVPLDSTAREMAVAKAADLLYRLFRDAESGDRLDLSSRYLAVAVPLMQDDAAAAGEVAQARSVARARRVLEIATQRDVQRLVAADAALMVLDNRPPVPVEERDELGDEITYRRVLLALVQDRIDEAQRWVDALSDEVPESIWARLANRRMFEQARNGVQDGRGDRALLVRLYVSGRRIIEESETIPEALSAASGTSLIAAVAEAGTSLGIDHGDSEARRYAYKLYGSLLEASPRNRTFLSNRGRLAGFSGEFEEALRCWRIITAGSRPGSDEWFEARTRIVELLAETDPDRAREVLDQHRALYPDFGPTPWGRRLRRVAVDLGTVGPESGPVNPEDDS